jgi:hypothetical protein
MEPPYTLTAAQLEDYLFMEIREVMWNERPDNQETIGEPEFDWNPSKKENA